MLSKLRKFIFGEALSNDKLSGEKFTVFWGLPILASDAISSVAYAGEAILFILIPVIGMKSYTMMLYAAICIVLLLFILVFSYSQTIDAYPNGGGSYIVAKDNLGTLPGLVAGVSLSIDYVLTVAVSISSGTAAITSAVPSLHSYKVFIALAVILFMTIGNLRGMKDSARIFGIPTYLFIVTMLTMIVVGIFKVAVLHQVTKPYYGDPTAMGNISILLFLKAFASGCTALTGVEAVSNGIPNFREPAQKNAKNVLLALGCIILFIFVGISYLAISYHGIPEKSVTVVAQIAIGVFGNGSFMFFLVQFTTAMILIIAANTSYADLPLLLSILSHDGFIPKQFRKRGKRLSFSNGIVLLAIFSSMLVIAFHASEQLLLPLYAVGVFISFTLSQFGMFKRWLTLKSKGWRHKAVINGIGATVTCVVSLLIGYTKFVHGAWAILILIPTLVFIMLAIKRHYIKVHGQYKLDLLEKPKGRTCDNSQHVVILIEYLNKPFLKCLNYAMNISSNIVAFHVSTDAAATALLKEKWTEYDIDIPLIIKQSPYRDIIQPLIEFIESEEHASKPGEAVTVVIAQAVITKWWQAILHKQTSLFIKSMLYKNRNIVVTTIPYIIEK
ncbi:MAG TPA: APC family permease [Clostridiaceae bacterium]